MYIITHSIKSTFIQLIKTPSKHSLIHKASINLPIGKDKNVIIMNVIFYMFFYQFLKNVNQKNLKEYLFLLMICGNITSLI